MPEFLSIRDADFWTRCPDKLRPMQEGRLTGGLAYFLMGTEAENPPTIAALRLGPGDVLPRHAHECYRFEIIVQGTLDVGDRVLTVGDVMVSEPHVAYGPHIAGPEGCTTFEIFGSLKASHTPIFETPEGQVQIDASTPEGRDRVVAIATRLRADGVKAEA